MMSLLDSLPRMAIGHEITEYRIQNCRDAFFCQTANTNMPKSTTQQEKRSIYHTQVLDRVMQTLCAFRTDEPELSFSEILLRVKLHKSTLYRLLEALQSHGLIGRDPVTQKYHLGLKLLELGSLAGGRLEAVKPAMPILQQLARQTGETAHLCILDGTEVVYVAKVLGTQAFHVPSTVGRRNPAYCTGVGKAILAQLEPEQLDLYLAKVRGTPLRAMTKRTITSLDELVRTLAHDRERGYSVDDEEISEGLRCVGAPVRDYTGNVVAGISIAGPSVRVTKAQIPALGRMVIAAADEISAKLGCRRSETFRARAGA